MMSGCRGSGRQHAATFVPRDSLTAEKGGGGGSLFHAFLGVRSAYRGKLVVTAAQSRSGETVQQQQDRQKGGVGGKKRGKGWQGRSYATRTRMSPAASRIYHKKNEWSIRE